MSRGMVVEADVQILAEAIVAEEGFGHNDAPLLCDYEPGGACESTEQYERYLDQAKWIIQALKQHGWELKRVQ